MRPLAVAVLISFVFHFMLVAGLRWKGGTKIRSEGAGSAGSLEVSLLSWNSTAKPNRSKSLHKEISVPEELDTSSENSDPNPTSQSTGEIGKGRSSQIFGEDLVDTPPQLSSQPKLKYPQIALRDGIESDVIVVLVISDLGEVVEANLPGHAGYGFDEVAIDAAKRLKFKPATKAGKPVAVRAHWTCRFRIES
jgi:TonB family protein